MQRTDGGTPSLSCMCTPRKHNLLLCAWLLSTALPGCLHCLRILLPAHVPQNLDDAVLDRIDDALESTDLLVIVGTSSVVYPAAGYAPQVAQR